LVGARRSVSRLIEIKSPRHETAKQSGWHRAMAHKHGTDTMADRDRNDFTNEPSRWSTEAVWSTLLVLVLGVGVLMWSYTAPKPSAVSHRAMEHVSPQ
jgi:hypothetical protein